MNHELVLHVPDEVYNPLADTANKTGATPEGLAVEWLIAVSRHAARDPVEKFIGSVHGSIPDWADRHDRYLGQALTQTNDDIAGN